MKKKFVFLFCFLISDSAYSSVRYVSYFTKTSQELCLASAFTGAAALSALYFLNEYISNLFAVSRMQEVERAGRLISGARSLSELAIYAQCSRLRISQFHSSDRKLFAWHILKAIHVNALYHNLNYGHNDFFAYLERVTFTGGFPQTALSFNPNQKRVLREVDQLFRIFSPSPLQAQQALATCAAVVFVGILLMYKSYQKLRQVCDYDLLIPVYSPPFNWQQFVLKVSIPALMILSVVFFKKQFPCMYQKIGAYAYDIRKRSSEYCQNIFQYMRSAKASVAKRVYSIITRFKKERVY